MIFEDISCNYQLLNDIIKARRFILELLADNLPKEMKKFLACDNDKFLFARFYRKGVPVVSGLSTWMNTAFIFLWIWLRRFEPDLECKSQSSCNIKCFEEIMIRRVIDHLNKLTSANFTTAFWISTICLHETIVLGTFVLRALHLPSLKHIKQAMRI